MDIPPFKRNDIPAVILPLMHFNNLGAYYPVIYHNDFFLASKNLIEINDTQRGDLVLELSYSHMSFMRWYVTPPHCDFVFYIVTKAHFVVFYFLLSHHIMSCHRHMQTQMEQQWKVQTNMGTSSERDTDMIREVLFDTNPILLVITFFVSLLHSLFDFLAFKNDIQFWRKKKSMAGMSVQTLGVNCFFQTVIFLYLMDNDTSWMILMSSGIGLLIEYWKLGKAFNVTISRQKQEPAPLLLSAEKASTSATKKNNVATHVDQQDTGTENNSQALTTAETQISESANTTSLLGVSVSYKLSDGYANSKTKEYDAIATTHLLYLVLPLVLGYSVYSLLHISHKSFYSWFLGSLVGFVYAFGFVLMTPQLFINYKLQSVAHMVSVEYTLAIYTANPLLRHVM
jgi:hypothetical protein